jgi:hypothetical protein
MATLKWRAISVRPYHAQPMESAPEARRFHPLGLSVGSSYPRDRARRIARHVVLAGCRVTQATRVQSALDGVAGNVRQSLPRGVSMSAVAGGGRSGSAAVRVLAPSAASARRLSTTTPDGVRGWPEWASGMFGWPSRSGWAAATVSAAAARARGVCLARELVRLVRVAVGAGTRAERHAICADTLDGPNGT